MTVRSSIKAKKLNTTTHDPGATNLHFEHAWRYFTLVANQRMALFNYFLIIAGVLATAVAAAVKDGTTLIVYFVSGLGLLCAIAFHALDVRNRTLVKYGEKLLCDLEQGPSRLDLESKLSSIFIRDQKDSDNQPGFRFLKLNKHRTWIRAIELYVGVFFLTILVLEASGMLSQRDRPRPDADNLIFSIRLTNLERKLDILLKGDQNGKKQPPEAQGPTSHSCEPGPFSSIKSSRLTPTGHLTEAHARRTPVNIW